MFRHYLLGLILMEKPGDDLYPSKIDPEPHSKTVLQLSPEQPK